MYKNKHLAIESSENCKNYIAEKVNSNIINSIEDNRFDFQKESILDDFVDFSEEQTEILIQNKLNDFLCFTSIILSIDHL